MTRGSDDGRYFKMHIKYVRVHSTILNNICDFRPWPDTRPAHQPGESRLRLVTVVVSVHGALGSEAQTLIRQVSARVTGAVPYRLLDDASWATQGCAPLFRSALTFAARRALATGIRLSTCTAAEAATAERRAR